MPVLILALLSVVLFIMTLVLLGFAEAAENRKMRILDFQEDGSPFCVLSVCDAFESEYAVLWETQIPALRLVAAASKKGIPQQVLLNEYQHASRMFPELYDGTSFRQWLDFLQRSELVSVRQERIYITPQGTEFLRYRVETKVAA